MCGQPTQQIWTNLLTGGPNHLGLWFYSKRCWPRTTRFTPRRWWRLRRPSSQRSSRCGTKEMMQSRTALHACHLFGRAAETTIRATIFQEDYRRLLCMAQVRGQRETPRSPR